MSTSRLLDHWSPPDGAGAPVACLASTFTFQADFFTDDCLSRFLSLSTVSGEGDAISSLVAVLEEEDRLSETQVTVLVDRSCPAEKRNLRWDVLPVAVPGGLLHAKVAALIWERTARIILGSANLTPAGYRRQVELALTIDLDSNCRVPRSVLEEMVSALAYLVDLAPGPLVGPKARARDTLDLLGSRIAALDLPAVTGGELRVAVAPARPGVSPLDRLPDVWRGSQPLSATVLSPFWDNEIPAPAVDAVRRRLTGRPATARSLTLVAGIDPFTGAVQAPVSLASEPDARVVAFDPPPPDTEQRLLHAKLVLFESADWLAVLIGSSNATAAGLGLNRHSGHQELNLWIGCPAGSPAAKELRRLARIGPAIDLEDDAWEPLPDEDEPVTVALPLGFVSCMVSIGAPSTVVLILAVTDLPADWEVCTPSGHPLLTATDWVAAGSPREPVLALPDEVLPAYLFVRWKSAGEACEATWMANVEDRTALPPPPELAELHVDLLLAALASTRPLPAALEQQLRRQERLERDPSRVELDPLKRFDDTGLLLQRTRQTSLALWRLQDRLSRPVTSLDALHWRLYGAFGPLAIADGLIRAAGEKRSIPGEAHFLLAELALTVAAVDWPAAASGLDTAAVTSNIDALLDALEERYGLLPPAEDAALGRYVSDAFQAARR